MAVLGFTAALSIMNDSGGTTYTVITPNASITIAESEVPKVDITSLDQTNPCRRYVAGIINPGTISWTTQYTKATWLMLQGILGKSYVQTSFSIPPTGTVPLKLKITLPNDEVGGSPTASTAIYTGFLSKLGMDAITPEGDIMIKAEWTVSDLPTIS